MLFVRFAILLLSAVCSWQITAVSVEDKDLCSLYILAHFTCDVDTQVSSAGEAQNNWASPEVIFQTPGTLLGEKNNVSFWI